MNFRNKAGEWLGRATGTPPGSLTISRLKGSTSSSVFLVQHGPQQFVLRVLDNAEWLAEEPDLAAHEAAALDEAQRAGLPAPRLVAYSSADAGFGAPVVLMSFIEGNVELRPSRVPLWLTALAESLAAIHRHRAEEFPWRFRSWVDKAMLAVPSWTTVPQLWERAIERSLGDEPPYQTVFIHRDYHPTNVLWQDGKVSGVVDWINACQGPAGVDVAHCRTNLALMSGPAAADGFLHTYCEAARGFVYDPYWDIDSLLDMCLSGPSFYGPWQEFGLEVIAPETLRLRVDDYLKSVMRRA